MFTNPGIRRSRAGMTLVEVVVASAVGSLLAVAVASFIIYSARSFVSIMNYSEMQGDSRNALDIITQEIRQATALTSYSTNNLTFDLGGTPLSYTYDAAAKTLIRSRGGENKTLLRQCDTLTFSIFQRNPVGGTYDQYPTATAATCKLVQLYWICSRKVLGTRLNTETIRSAKIVIRKG